MKIPMLLRFGAVVLVVANLAGGWLAVRAGVNTWTTAFTGAARLSTPWPMLLVQLGAAVLAAHPRRAVALAGSIVLVLATAVSLMSGFFDGALGARELGAGELAFQGMLLAVIAAVWLLGIARLAAVARR